MYIRTLGATVMGIAMLLVGAVGAQAAVTAVQVSGTTLAVTGSSGADAPRFTFYSGATAADPNFTRIFDPDGVSDPLPALCSRFYFPDPEGQAAEDVVFCEDGGTSTQSLLRLELTLGAGADAPDLRECFNEVDIDAGEGANTVAVPECGGGTLSVTSGAGQDSLLVPAFADPPVLVAITADLGAGDDSFTGGAGPSVIHGGAGNDYLVGNAGNDELFGDDGDDTFLGHGGNDRYDGGAGDDKFGQTKGLTNDDDLGNDDYRGGAGSDLLVLDGHASGMTISIDELANDGSSGEADNVHNDIELIRGTSKNDVFTGGPATDKFEGEGGADTIRGGDGDDDLSGGGGDDKVYGDAGNDKVQGTSGADTVEGGVGTDQLYGDIAACSVFCSFDSDVLLARDGERDSVDCGGGADTAQVDGLDVVAFCAAVDRSAAGAPPASPAPPGTSSPFTFATRGSPRVSKGIGASVTCPAACTFTVSVVLSAKTARKYGLGQKSLTAGIARGTLLAAGSKKVTVKLSKKVKRRLARAKKVPATLKIKVTDAAGKSATKTKAIRLGR